MYTKIAQTTLSAAQDWAKKSGATSTMTYEKIFRSPVDLPIIDKILEKNIAKGEKTNVAIIGLGAKGIEPLTCLTQIYLTARKSGKSLDDVLGQVDFIDIQRASEIGHSRQLLTEIEQNGAQYFKNFNNGLAEKELDTIYSKFIDILKKSDSKYLGKNLEDFAEDRINHNKYDLTFCNNVFYYVGNGKPGSKYFYRVPGQGFGGYDAFFGSDFSRYYEVIRNVASTLRSGGHFFFHHDANKATHMQKVADLKEALSTMNGFKLAQSEIVEKL